MKLAASRPFAFVTLAMAAVIVAVFAAELAGDGMGLCQRFGFVASRPSFEAAVTSAFIHDPSGIAHVSGDLVFLVVFGSIVERAIGSFGFLVLYLGGGLAGAAMHLIVDPASTMPLIGCSGALFGPAMLAFTAMLVASNIVHAFGGPGDVGVSYGDHLGGFAAGVVLVVLARLRGIDLRRAVAA